jgi:predicted GNAT family acetyltransferase
MPPDPFGAALSDNPAAHRFELHVGGQLAAYAEYNLLEGAILFTHTEVLPAYEGSGHGSRIAKYVLDQVRERGLRAIPVCQFIAGYIRRHPEYRDLVAPTHLVAFNI